ncbi:NADH dehydrogenase subunit D [Candidatus Marsarchaeota G1 archaeon OSP_D]|uniref:NADH dehydrogenase subunit D n=2 Tax=Candidatus Marsarchaeota group 1 TaxID=2203770 RepID=A0A2R6AD55_9ARCH|nr:MAG: NADH dehydrogenase subunit D [Candidatus Marsarchaeota G1 archaeon OSP_D]PSN89443.1 MAG: NADH dehydrogenase subunit D [Candidatus Marsarchaeota G1 archaeon OSP_C]
MSASLVQQEPLSLEKNVVTQLEQAFAGKLSAKVVRKRRVWAQCSNDVTIDVLRFAKEKLQFDHLNFITAVDWKKYFDLVYNLWSIANKVELMLKTQLPHTDKDELVPFPTSTTVYQAAEWPEREVYDLFGIEFKGHPDLRRILLREDWTTHPLRKVYDRRGYPINPSLGLSGPPETWRINEGKIALPAKWLAENPEVEEEILTINFGPHHPSTHGPLMIRFRLDGEIVVDDDIVIGYLHRNHEKLGENNTWIQMLPYPDRTNYISPINWEWAYVSAVEELAGIEPPERAEYIRVIMAELDRIQSHLMFLATAGDEVGQLTGFVWGLRDRELVLDINEMVCGARMLPNYFRFGGVNRDLPKGAVEKIHEALNTIEKHLEEFSAIYEKNPVFLKRFQGTGVLRAQDAIEWGAVGPPLRASNVPFDVRKDDPYSVYDRFEFDVVVGKNGDNLDRFLVRVEEIKQSISIVRQALKELPSSPYQAKAPVLNLPEGEASSRIETPRGEGSYYIVSDGSPRAVRMKIKSPSLMNVYVAKRLMVGQKLQDAIVTFGTFDPVLGEIDR